MQAACDVYVQPVHRVHLDALIQVPGAAYNPQTALALAREDGWTVVPGDHGSWVQEPADAPHDDDAFVVSVRARRPCDDPPCPFCNPAGLAWNQVLHKHVLDGTLTSSIAEHARDVARKACQRLDRADWDLAMALERLAEAAAPLDAHLPVIHDARQALLAIGEQRLAEDLQTAAERHAGALSPEDTRMAAALLALIGRIPRHWAFAHLLDPAPAPAKGPSHV